MFKWKNCWFGKKLQLQDIEILKARYYFKGILMIIWEGFIYFYRPFKIKCYWLTNNRQFASILNLIYLSLSQNALIIACFGVLIAVPPLQVSISTIVSRLAPPPFRLRSARREWMGQLPLKSWHVPQWGIRLLPFPPFPFLGWFLPSLPLLLRSVRLGPSLHDGARPGASPTAEKQWSTENYSPGTRSAEQEVWDEAE